MILHDVCIIGAGAGGLISASVFRKKGFSSTVFEATGSVGGVWKYPKPGAAYKDLRCNLPKEIMAFSADHPFDACNGASFVGREDVLRYLTNFAETEKLADLIKFNSSIESVEKREISGKWKVIVQGRDEPYTFDAVVVANGHYNQPFVPTMDGIQLFKGSQMHSIDYDSPEIYSGKRVLVVGTRASGSDLGREISRVADAVFISDRSLSVESQSIYGNIHHVPGIRRFTATGVELIDGKIREIDAIIWCTGYKYGFPFLKDDVGSSIARASSCGRYVKNLYQHLFSIGDNTLAFLGLPYQVIPFALMEFQAQWVASVWMGRSYLPAERLQQDWLKNDIEAAKERSSDLRSYHLMGDSQWEYYRLMIIYAGINVARRLQYVEFLRSIWDHVGPTRGKLPGVPDDYRKNVYNVDDRETLKWEVSRP